MMIQRALRPWRRKWQLLTTYISTLKHMLLSNSTVCWFHYHRVLVTGCWTPHPAANLYFLTVCWLHLHSLPRERTEHALIPVGKPLHEQGFGRFFVQTNRNRGA
jgi:hypothetical protein